MKMKKAIIIALSLVLVLALFTSCDEPKHEHTWNDGEVTTAATCTDKGLKTFTCTACKETKTEEIPALGHDLEVVIVDSGYVNKGSKTTTCTRKGCDFCNVEELEVKSLTGKWLKTKINSYYDAYLAFSKTEGQKNKVYAGESSAYHTVVGDEACTMVFDTTMDFTYSITYEEEKPKITIKNETGDSSNPYFTQYCDISEKVVDGETIITIEDMVLGGEDPATRDFSIVPAHDFTLSEDYNTWIYTLLDDSHVGGWICTEEIKEDDLRFVLVEMSSGGQHDTKGEGDSCSVCGYKSAKLYHQKATSTVK